ncbi:MAG: 23S rRNA (guanosine(2251)-2'-O)-methyltransferase RlmB, partial [Silvanigrellales bacterium]|nr:23S rRNA (guanosine(2251)-2'-O)-methyltransferase RlmB [Silvanigrellales bacterium]
ERFERPERARPERARPERARPEHARSEKTGRERAPLLVWGRRPVEAMLADLVGKEGAKVSAYSLFLLADKEGKVPAQLRDAVDSAKAVGIRVKVCKGHEDETWPLLGDEALNHQRLCLIVPEFPTVALHDILRNVREKAAAGEKGCLGIVFDQVQDPRNFGSVLRSAAFFGAGFAIFGEDRQAALTSTVIKASAGGAFSLQLAPVVNLNRALAQLKEAGVWVVGSSLGENAVAPEGVPNDRPYVLVLGNEGKGMRQEVARNCDYVVRIPGGNATVDSLNVGVAAGILLARLQSGRVVTSTRL